MSSDPPTNELTPDPSARGGVPTRSLVPDSGAQGEDSTTLGAPARRGGFSFALDNPPGYEILGEIARGGMGIVYKARQQNPHRVVAIKMILDGPFIAPGGVQRF